MTTTPFAEIQSLSPTAVIELFVLDTSPIPGSGNAIYRFHSGTNQLGTNVVWQGYEYVALPIGSDGFKWSSKGTLPRPRLSVAALDGTIGALIHSLDDLVGASVTLKRCFAKYLDAVNFPGGVNPTADPTKCWPDEPWFIERKISESKDVIEFELVTPLDVQSARIPKRVIVANACPWAYRGAECGYAGTSYFKADDTPTTADLDVCGKRLTSCKLRFGSKDAELPFGGFPGAARVR